MEPSELALFTSQELIDELVRRSTFLGVVVHAEDEARAKVWRRDRMFKVRFNTNLNATEAGRLLEVIAHHLDHNTDA